MFKADQAISSWAEAERTKIHLTMRLNVVPIYLPDAWASWDEKVDSSKENKKSSVFLCHPAALTTGSHSLPLPLTFSPARQREGGAVTQRVSLHRLAAEGPLPLPSAWRSEARVSCQQHAGSYEEGFLGLTALGHT